MVLYTYCMHTIKTVLRAPVLLALFILVSMASACKDEPPSVESATIARSKFCKDGGAEFNPDSNECACPYAAHWTGAKCEADGDQKPAAKPEPEAPVMATVPPAEPKPAEEPKPEAQPAQAPTETAPATPGPVDEALKVACKRAKAHWVEDAGYCLCPKNQVLMGRVCRDAKGRITDDACLRAVHKGKWKKGDCVCPADQVFVPGRGGCVARPAPSETPNVTLLRRVCESSINDGKWDVAQARCNCPVGRIWHDELCQAQQKLTSRVVCESAFNQGTWDKKQKTCTCKPGTFWINQRCLSAATLTEKAACDAESSKGKWSAQVNRCICPGLTKWDPKTLNCVK